MPFFSIIIPTYNRSHIIVKTIASVQNQTFKDWECLIIDDGSTDETKIKVKSIGDSRIRYIYQNNAERSAARNNGISQAKGTYICFLDSDDEYMPNHLETIYNNLKDVKALYITNAYNKIEDKLTKPNYPRLEKNALEYVFKEPITPTRVCIHKDILKQIKFDEDIVIVEDLVMWCKIAVKFAVYHIQEYTVQYILHEDNSVNLKNNSYLNRYKGLQLFYKRYPHVTSKIPKRLRNKITSNTLFGISKHYIYTNQKLKAFKYTCKSIYTNPLNKMTVHRLLVMLSICGLYHSKVISDYENN